MMRRPWEKGWKRNRKECAVNVDLWERLLVICEKHEVEFVWVRGHAGHPENERCDLLAEAAARADELPPDAGYEERVAQASANQGDQPTLFDE